MLKFFAELHLLLTPNVAHKDIFTNMEELVLKMTDHLSWTTLLKFDTESRTKHCGEKNSLVR